jgi:hypothetical protein
VGLAAAAAEVGRLGPIENLELSLPAIASHKRSSGEAGGNVEILLPMRELFGLFATNLIPQNTAHVG